MQTKPTTRLALRVPPVGIGIEAEEPAVFVLPIGQTALARFGTLNVADDQYTFRNADCFHAVGRIPQGVTEMLLFLSSLCVNYRFACNT